MRQIELWDFSDFGNKVSLRFEEKLWIPKHISPVIEQSNVVVNDDIQTLKYQSGKIIILSKDDSGMLNITSGKALLYVEMALKNKSGNLRDRMASDEFSQRCSSLIKIRTRLLKF
ncbi:unnamed protein product [Fraxinus pennsylvanica]|uniref:Uncharacterized protein n=1 Tax=Fraxinus pennsylvanica TaxID=56036 RepID=A0AAD2AEY6_9LAMI|nr:unnamed protein product [Fraxinus pennsylvanica]